MNFKAGFGKNVLNQGRSPSRASHRVSQPALLSTAQTVTTGVRLPVKRHDVTSYTCMSGNVTKQEYVQEYLHLICSPAGLSVPATTPQRGDLGHACGSDSYISIIPVSHDGPTRGSKFSPLATKTIF